MRILPLILTVLLTAAWAYTSWYWYTCNIKGFCSNEVSQGQTVPLETQQLESVENVEDVGSIEDFQEGEDTELLTGTGESSNSPRLSASDVLFDPLPKEIEETPEDVTEDLVDEEIEQEEGESETTGTGESIETVNTDLETQLGESESETQVDDSQESISVCDTPLVGPIGLGRENLAQEVKSLELFLISRGEEVEIDGIYDENDFEAVKRFQLEYKEDVLEPWGIENPTGYVGRTSISKINEIACK